MAIKYGDDIVYAREKLYGSYIKYKDTIVQVEDINGAGECCLIDLTGHMHHDLLENLDLEPVQLGYVNDDMLAYYYARMPQRHYRQGFRNSTVVALTAMSKSYVRPRFNKGLILSYRNIFPSVESCIEYVFNGEKQSSAFSKYFALNNYNKDDNILLEYKGVNVGNVDVQKDEMILSNKYLFLKESLETWL